MLGLRIAFGLALSCLLAACLSDNANYRSPAPRPDITKMSANEVLGIVSRVIDCEWQAVGRYDDGQSTIAELAQRIIDICAVERMRAKVAVGLSPKDPQLEADDFKQAVEIAENARKSQTRKP
jgi:hypothetical protein